jgi:hypothetical protein
MQLWTDDGVEIPLAGGDVTEGLVRIGDKIRRRQTWLEANADSITTSLLS